MKQLAVPFTVIVLALLASCTKEDNPAEPPQSPSLSIDIQSQNPSIGVPVAFQAEYSGPALISPTYEWEYGDGTDVYISSTGSPEHTYIMDGTYTVHVHLIDSLTSIELTATAAVQVMDGRTVSVVVLTGNPELGGLTEFKAEYVGPALGNPTYEWDFGDSTTILISVTDTVSHIYKRAGMYTVSVTIADPAYPVPIQATAMISVVDNRPIWQRWTKASFSFYGKAKYRYTRKAGAEVVVDSTYYSTDTFGMNLYPAPMTEWYVRNVQWSGNEYLFHFYDNKGIIGTYNTIEIDDTIRLSDDGTVMTHFGAVQKTGSHSSGTMSYTSGAVYMRASSIPLRGDMTEESAEYYVQGEAAYAAIQDMSYSYYNSLRNERTVLVELEPTGDMWLKITLYE